MNKHIITYKSVVTDEQATEIHLFHNDNDVAVIELEAVLDDIDDLCIDIELFIEEHNPNLRFEIKNDGDKLGIIVDVWDDVQCLDTACFWFDDYIYLSDDLTQPF